MNSLPDTFKVKDSKGRVYCCSLDIRAELYEVKGPEGWAVYSSPSAIEQYIRQGAWEIVEEPVTDGQLT